MIRLTVDVLSAREMYPVPQRAGEVIVYNDGTGTPENGNYVVQVRHVNRAKDGKIRNRCSVFKMEGYPRDEGDAFELALAAGMVNLLGEPVKGRARAIVRRLEKLDVAWVRSGVKIFGPTADTVVEDTDSGGESEETTDGVPEPSSESEQI